MCVLKIAKMRKEPALRVMYVTLYKVQAIPSDRNPIAVTC